jgi:exopolyphosphatase/guanosine-5'-triphosphate,3'-diphosphate pyrophosphatase
MLPPAESKTAAVIDVGSNTIKLLVARGAPAGISRIHARTLEARLGAGLGRERPRLAPDSLARGIDAVRTLAAEARVHGADVTAVVATSAVRDAENGLEFAAAVTSATGLPLRILSGTDEARLIGRGLRCDPALTAADDLALFDLGGGSLEALEFRGAAVRCALSLPLGCVRLTERFVPNPALPLPETARGAIARHATAIATEAGLTRDAFRGLPVAATGGTVSTARAMLAAAAGIGLDDSSPEISVALLRELLDRVGALPLAARHALPGLSAARADVFPAALATLVAMADLTGCSVLRHSWWSLRHGVAAELLAGRAP